MKKYLQFLFPRIAYFAFSKEESKYAVGRMYLIFLFLTVTGPFSVIPLGFFYWTIITVTFLGVAGDHFEYFTGKTLAL